MTDGYTHIEMDLVAVRDEDVKAVQRAFVAIRDRYSHGGSSFGTSRTSDQAFIREEMKPEGNSWRLCLIGGCAFEDGRCFNCGGQQEGEDRCLTR